MANSGIASLGLTSQAFQNAITLPTLLTRGDFDEAGVKTLKDCQLSMPNAFMAVLPNASHLHHLEKPDLFLCIIREFLHDFSR